jgi:hypothetical protein
MNPDNPNVRKTILPGRVVKGTIAEVLGVVFTPAETAQYAAGTAAIDALEPTWDDVADMHIRRTCYGQQE